MKTAALLHPDGAGRRERIALPLLARGFASTWSGGLWSALLLASAALFAAGYAVFLWIYAPLLAAPRVDGREG